MNNTISAQSGLARKSASGAIKASRTQMRMRSGPGLDSRERVAEFVEHDEQHDLRPEWSGEEIRERRDHGLSNPDENAIRSGLGNLRRGPRHVGLGRQTYRDDADRHQ